jgi:HD-GYP domain-containing protein (c-di-GMP phosphodiesterase class II)
MGDERADIGAEMADRLLRFNDELAGLRDVDAILDRILLQARSVARAEAGSIFLVEGDSLRFSYVHNDTLFEEGHPREALYADFKVPVDERSIVGYAAKTGSPLVIDDAYALPEGLPYRFNRSFDDDSGYRTRSILTIPLKTAAGVLVGVMQILNARDEAGAVAPFDRLARGVVPLLAANAAVAVERGLMTRELVLRMMRMAELRDPTETGAHVQRVGAYSAELYKRWAQSRMQARGTLLPGDGVPEEPPEKEILRVSDRIRLAAMLHDVGKVAIPDAILKKPGALTDEERAEMQGHTVRGAELFDNPTSDLDAMCRDVAGGHHEQWAGAGYPARVAGERIPLPARIVALADVYDALVSRRCYKDGWPEEKVLGILAEESGRHFDPELVEAFVGIHDVILAIRNRYKGPEEQARPA